MERGTVKKGDVVLVTFPFTDLSGEKRRPSLVVGASEEHIVVAFITTRATGPKRWHTPLPATEQNGLVSPSVVRCDKILSVDTGLIRGAIGAVSVTTTRHIDTKLRRLLKL